jgi:hypothetical protein
VSEWHLGGIGVVKTGDGRVSFIPADGRDDFTSGEARELAMSLLDAADTAEGTAGCR